MSKRDANRPTFGCPSTCHIIVTIGERATYREFRTKQVAPVSAEIQFSSLHIRMTWGPAGVMRRGSRLGSGTPLVTVQSLLSEICKEQGPVGATPWISHRRAFTRTFPFQCPLFWQKAHWFTPRWFLVCPASSALQGPLEVVVESEPKAVFFSLSLLAFSVVMNLEVLLLPSLTMGFGAQPEAFIIFSKCQSSLGDKIHDQLYPPFCEVNIGVFPEHLLLSSD